jgi:hypothetical protein
LYVFGEHLSQADLEYGMRVATAELHQLDRLAAGTRDLVYEPSG